MKFNKGTYCPSFALAMLPIFFLHSLIPGMFGSPLTPLLAHSAFENPSKFN